MVGNKKNNVLSLTLQNMDSPLVLMGRGERMFPLCCNTAFVIEALETSDFQFEYVNIISNRSLDDGRVSMKMPEFPLLFSHERLLGGYDYVRSLFVSGHMADLHGEIEK